MDRLDPDSDYQYDRTNRPLADFDTEGVECHAHDCRRFIGEAEAATKFNGWWYCVDCAAAFETDDQHDAEDQR